MQKYSLTNSFGIRKMLTTTSVLFAFLCCSISAIANDDMNSSSDNSLVVPVLTTVPGIVMNPASVVDTSTGIQAPDGISATPVPQQPAAQQPVASGTAQDVAPIRYAIALHGGAGSTPDRYPDEANVARHQSLERALTIGNDILKNGGTAMDAVERVVMYLEDDPQFNAGRGAVYNEFGSHELDASIMDGSTKDVGACAGVSRVKNPIALARRVMTNTPHCMMGGQGAEQFAGQQGLIMVNPNYFDTPSTMNYWLRTRNAQPAGNSSNTLPVFPPQPGDTGSAVGTVGCVALDGQGNLAAATSTGGVSNKKYGRIGDSPIIGAGNYADNATCAISGTGIGEKYIRNTVCYDVAAQMMYGGRTLEEAVRDNLENRLEPGDGGAIAIDKDGNIVMLFNTGGMARAAADSTGRFEVIWDPNRAPQSVSPDQ